MAVPIRNATKVDFAGKCVSFIPSTRVSGIVSAATTTSAHSKATIWTGLFHLPSEKPETAAAFFFVIMVESMIPEYPK